jgi:hypothetical protein
MVEAKLLRKKLKNGLIVDKWDLVTIIEKQQAEIEVLNHQVVIWEEATMQARIKSSLQQAEIEALKDFAIWMTGCGYDFCQHDYFIKCRDELLVGKAQEK